ncbi:MAG TPA: sulfite exporter TauE/SafE family protein [Thermoplasmata archaeon]|nr:sulfite exporter TauE/SafE family protein [Thermoplasmata archaeon]
MDIFAFLGLPLPTGVSIGALFLISIAAGAIGAMLGIGGGLVLVPVLVVLFGVDIHFAIATSLVSVIATSTGAASTEVEAGYTNVRLGVFLETATSTGALLGALVAVTVLASRGDVLVWAFVPVVVGAGGYMLVQRGRVTDDAPPPDRLARRLSLVGECPDLERGGRRRYAATNTSAGLLVAGLAGVASGLLGVGGGLFKVPAMNSLMRIPFRVAGATSTFMIGVTAAASALVYLFAGDVVLLLTVPTAFGTLAGSRAGAGLRAGTSATMLRRLFAVALFASAATMALEAAGVIS